MAAVVRFGDWVVSSARTIWSADELVAAQEAAGLIDESTLRAKKIVEDARREAETIRATAQAEGFKSGEAQALKHILGRLGNQESLTRSVRDFVIDAVVASVGGFLANDPDSARYRAMLDTVDRSLAGWTWLTLRVAPVCVEEAVSIVAGMPVRISERASVTADDSLSPGECVIESDVGWLDGRINTQLERVRTSVAEMLVSAESAGRGT